MKPNILIAVPAYRETVFSNCSHTVFEIGKRLLANGIDSTLLHISSSDVAKVRNVYASLLYSMPRFSHILFYDNDIGTDPNIALRLVAAARDIIACVCPKRTNPIEFNVHFRLPAGTPADGIYETDRVGTGIMLIRRNVIEALVATNKLRSDPKHEIRGLNGTLYGFFDQANGLTEDYSFCVRWRELCSGTVYVMTNADISHMGENTFTGNFAKYLEETSRHPAKQA